MEDQEERQQVVHNRLQQATFNFPKLYLPSHYGSQVVDFGTLQQYSTEIIEALYMLLKDAYMHLNRVDAVGQILNIIFRDYAIRMRELNLIAWSREVQLPHEVLEVLGAVKDCARRSRLARGRTTTKRRPTLGGKQSADNSSGSPLVLLAVVLELASLPQLFVDYLKLNVPHIMLPPALKEISNYRAHYYNNLWCLLRSSKVMRNSFMLLGGRETRSLGSGASEEQIECHGYK